LRKIVRDDRNPNETCAEEGVTRRDRLIGIVTERRLLNALATH